KYVTIPLHQDFKLNNGQTLKIEKLEVMAYGNKLYFRVGEGERTVQGIKGGFTWESIGNEMQDAQFNVFEEESGYSIMLVPFFRITPRMDFTVQGISYAGDKDVTFNIPVNIEEKEMPHKIGEVE